MNYPNFNSDLFRAYMKV